MLITAVCTGACGLAGAILVLGNTAAKLIGPLLVTTLLTVVACAWLLRGPLLPGLSVADAGSRAVRRDVSRWLPSVAIRLPIDAAPVALALAVGLAIVAQAALLRTQGPLPAIPGFLLAIGAGVWGARISGWEARRLAMLPQLTRSAVRLWWVGGLLALLANDGALLLFARNGLPNLAWLLFVSSIVGILASAWLLDGRPRPTLHWRDRRGTLAALGAIIIVGLTVRVLWLDRVPYGVWFDEAYSSLQVLHIMRDASFRPVFFGALAQAPTLFWYMAVPFFKIFGPVALSMRLVNAIGGVACVLAIYLAGRQLYGRKAGLIAAAVMATFGWNITFSRFVANPAVWSVALDALALFFTLRALERRSWSAAALAGASLGLGTYMYYTSRIMVLVLAAVVGAYYVTRSGPGWRDLARTVAAMAVAGLICYSPLLEYSLQHPTEFNQRTATVSIFTQMRNEQRTGLGPVLENARAHVLMFNLHGDRNARHNLPGAPELDVVLGGLAVLGLGLALAKVFRPQFMVLPVWAVAMLAGGVFSLTFEAPQSLRTLDETNVVALLAALPLVMLWDALIPAVQHIRTWSRGHLGATPPTLLAGVPILVMVGWSGFLQVDGYFNKHQADASTYAEYSTPETLVSRETNSLPEGTKIFLDERYAGTPTTQFLSPRLQKASRFTAQALPLEEAADTAFLLAGDHGPDVSLIERFYPRATVKRLAPPSGSPLLVFSILVRQADVDATQGVTGHYEPAAGGPAVDRRENAIDTTAERPPASDELRAQWTAVLAAPAFGNYQIELEGPTTSELSLDGNVETHGGDTTTLLLARGSHALSVKSDVGSGKDVRLLWRVPQTTELVVVPRTSLFVSPVTATGLRGSYFKNQSWQGQPALEQVDPNVAFYFHQLPLPTPFSVEWSGSVLAPVAGTYRFGTEAIDSSQVIVDGQMVIDNHQPNAYQDGQVRLTEGPHDIRVRYEAHSRSLHVNLWWQRPGGQREIIPSNVLLPAKATAAAAPPAAAPPPALPESPSAALPVDWQLDVGRVIGADSVPVALASSADGSLYVVDGGRRQLEKLDVSGRVLWATSGRGVDLQQPTAVAAAADGSTFVLDAGTGYIWRLSADGQPMGKIGGSGLAVYQPRGLSVSSSGHVYVSDTGGGRVLQLDPAGKIEATLSLPVVDDGPSGQPSAAIELPSGGVLVADPQHQRIVRYNDATPAEEWPLGQGGTVNGPQLALAADGSVWATDTSNDRLVHYTAAGKVEGFFTVAEGLSHPSGLAVGSDFVVVAEPEARRVSRLRLAH